MFAKRTTPVRCEAEQLHVAILLKRCAECGWVGGVCVGERTMGMPEVTAVAPDVFGLPVYRVNKCIKQRIGDEIHILMGQEVFGQTIWSHVEVWSVEDVLIQSQEFNDIALKAFWERRTGHH